MNDFVMRPVCFAAAAAILVSGCGALETRDYVHKTADKDAQSILAQQDELRSKDAQSLEVVREIDGVWLGRRTIKVSRDADLPAIFSQTILFQFPDRPSLTTIADRLSKITGIPVRVAPDALIPIEIFSQQQMAAYTAGGQQAQAGASSSVVPGTPGMPVPVGRLTNVPTLDSVGLPVSHEVAAQPFVLDLSTPYSGTFNDLLDQLSARYAVGWDFKDGVILISRFVTRTYQVASLIDTNTTNTSVSKSAGSSTSGGGSGSSGGAGGGTQSSTGSSTSTVSSNTESQLDVAEGLKESIKSALTPVVGKFNISKFGVVTVTDTREVQERVRELIDAENKAIGRQIRVRMVMIEVEASTKNDLGIDWTWAIAQASRKWNVDFAAPAGMLGGSGENAGQLGVIRNGSASATSVFLKALGEVGRVNVRKDETYTLMNNRPLAVSQVDNFVYPARSTAAASNSVGGNANTTSATGVEPGQLTTGNFLNMRAAVQPNGSVIVLFSLDSSRRGATETFTSNGAVLQYPQSTGGSYQTYASIPNGQTGIIAAVDSSSNEARDRSLDSKVSPLLGGGLYSNVVVKKTIILVTPVVIEGAS